MTTPSTVDFDLPCIACQYNLRMQPLDGRCPECRTAVPETLSRSPYLWNLRHVQEIAAALGKMAWAGLIPFVGYFLNMLLALGALPDRGEAGLFLFLIAIVATWAMHFRAARLIKRCLAQTEDSWDVFLPIGSGSGLVAAGLLVLSVAIAISRPMDNSLVKILLSLVGLLQLPAAGYFAVLGRRLGQLCAGCGFAGLSTAARWVLIPMGGCLVLGALCLIATALLQPFQNLRTVVAPVLDIANVVAMLGFMVLWIAATVFFFGARKRFATVATAIAARSS